MSRSSTFKKGIFEYRGGDELVIKGDLTVEGTLVSDGGQIEVTEPFTFSDVLTLEDDLVVETDADITGALTAGTVEATTTVVAGTTVTAGTTLVGADLDLSDDAFVAGDVVKEGASGSLYTLNTLTAIASVAAGKITFTDFIPAGSLVLLLTARVTTTITATASTAFIIGEGGDADRWGAANALTAGTTVAKGTVANIGGLFWAASNTTVLATGDAGDDLLLGAVRLSAVVLTPTAPTA